MATDIAFSLGILKILGQKVPLGLKIFLTAFAIIDDLGAVLVIALFYTTDIQWILLIYAGIILLVLYFLSYKQIHKKIFFFSMGLLVWLLFLKSGVHPTIAGILLAIAVPMHQKIDEFTFAEKLKKIVHEITANWNTNELPILTKK
jgi:NhaA family Na+:H+ antiporter